MITAKRQQVIDEARRYLGAPYAHMGETQAGIDCVKLAFVVGRACELVPSKIDFPPYQSRHLWKLMELFWHYVDPVDPEDTLPGDGLILCHAETNRKPRHLAFVTDVGILWINWRRTIQHVTEGVLTPELQAFAVGAWRYRGIDDE